MPRVGPSVWMIVPNMLRTLMRGDVGLKSKLLLLAGLIYLISPVDLLPDILVGFGWLDDIVIVPLLGWLSYRSLPPAVQDDIVPAESDAASSSRRVYLYLGLLIIVVILILVLGSAENATLSGN
ncbi:YkvA family protein [Thalassospira sp. SM2505]